MTALIIFDIDGTLLQTDLVTVPAVQRTLAAFGLPEPDAQTICAFFGRPADEYLAWLATLAPPNQATAIVDATNKLELELVGAEGRLYPGVLEVLNQLRHDGHVLAICSNGPDDYVNEFLDAHDVRRFFSVVRTRGNKYDNKRDMVREIMDIVPARPAIVIGDRQDDIEAAHANGAYAIAAGYGFGREDELARTNAKVSVPADIPQTVAGLALQTGPLTR